MITSTGNQQVKNLVQLKKKAKVRKEQNVFLAEGLKMFQEAPEDRIRQVYVSESFEREHGEALLNHRYEVLADFVFSYVSDTKTPQGVLCLVEQASWELKDLVEQPDPCLLVLENIQDPGNLGTMFRSAEGAGFSGVIMDGSTADIYNPKTIRSTMGSIYRVPFVTAKDLPAAVLELKELGVRVYAAHLKGTCCYDEPDYKKASAFLIGNEGNGLTDQLAELADEYVKIPMEGRLESLNAAVAASLFMYETNRQRRK
ncbi:Putative TrmH family tRNA/rRNA methyltransferase [uncultured Roseburia sp.]|uniref:RNA methyltransferase n=1 Tax=Brotonthovivens ammoniilytica TaxID=2981725 RepID=A0ABT2TK12_9FIRM|nr:RNA methyltransferase [Brotonthovivens ammoniilytica]MCU6762563.1 RNA methyltransferase [Brotonthovivens ammoniilytica]SCI75768.1 Putative TrmH family tRNA/rRNA methyltransferase [uncultured Roseburia sp.]